MGYTDLEYMNRGIYRELLKFTEDYAKSRGFKYVFSLLVSREMKHVKINTMGYKSLLEIPFAEIEFNGERPFAKFVEEDPKNKEESICYVIKKLE